MYFCETIIPYFNAIIRNCLYRGTAEIGGD